MLCPSCKQDSVVVVDGKACCFNYKCNVNIVVLDHIEKTAKEMFEELGYIKDQGKYYLFYTMTNPQNCQFTIGFNLEAKTYEIRYTDLKNSYPKNEYWHIIVEEHEAIHQQMKELGWFDE